MEVLSDILLFLWFAALVMLIVFIIRALIKHQLKQQKKSILALFAASLILFVAGALTMPEPGISFASADLVGKNYQEVEKAFKDANFNNIKVISSGDLSYSEMNQDGQVKTVKIDNLDHFDKGQKFQKNAPVEITYRTLSDAARTEQANHAAADPVIAAINGIGDVSLDSESKIADARKAYDQLTDDQKALVSNADVLTRDEAAFTAAKEEKERQAAEAERQAQEETAKAQKAKEDAAIAQKAQEEATQRQQAAQSHEQQKSTASAQNGSWNDDHTTNDRSKGQGSIVYWTENGKSYHSNPHCRSLARSKNIHSGPMSACPKSDPCNICYH